MIAAFVSLMFSLLRPDQVSHALANLAFVQCFKIFFVRTRCFLASCAEDDHDVQASARDCCTQRVTTLRTERSMRFLCSTLSDQQLNAPTIDYEINIKTKRRENHIRIFT